MATSIGDSGPYSGEVTPGGPPDVRELAGLVITKLAVDPDMSNNCYLLRCRATGEQVLIDAAADAPALLRLIGPRGSPGWSPPTSTGTTTARWPTSWA